MASEYLWTSDRERADRIAQAIAVLRDVDHDYSPLVPHDRMVYEVISAFMVGKDLAPYREPMQRRFQALTHFYADTGVKREGPLADALSALSSASLIVATQTNAPAS